MNDDLIRAWERLDRASSQVLVAQPDRMTEAAAELQKAQKEMRSAVGDGVGARIMGTVKLQLDREGIIYLLGVLPVPRRLIDERHPAQKYIGSQWDEGWVFSKEWLSKATESELLEILRTSINYIQTLWEHTRLDDDGPRPGIQIIEG